MDVTYEHGMVSHRFPFATAVGHRRMTLEERMYERMTTGAREYMLYRAKVSWMMEHSRHEYLKAEEHDEDFK